MSKKNITALLVFAALYAAVTYMALTTNSTGLAIAWQLLTNLFSVAIGAALGHIATIIAKLPH